MNLTLDNIQPSKLDNLVLYEPVDITILNKLIHSTLLKQTFHNPFSKHYYENEKQQLLKYRDLIVNGEARIIYKKAENKGSYGRCNPVKALGMYSIRREIRHTLCKNRFIDIDIDNCHPTILYQICQANDIKCDLLKDYVMNRQKYLELIMTTYKCDRDSAKKLFIIMLYCGSFDTWKKDNDITGDMIKEISEFSEEFNRIAKRITNENPQLKSIIEKTKKEGSIIGSVCSYYLQQKECEILEQVYLYCLQRGYIKNSVCVLCADGLMIEKRYYNENLLKELEELIQEKFKIKLNFSVKDMNQDYFNILNENVDYYNYYANIRDLSYESSELSTAEYLIKGVFKNIYVCADKKTDLFYYFNGNKWIVDKAFKLIYDYITKHLIKEVNELKIYVSNEFNDLKKKMDELKKDKEADTEELKDMLENCFNLRKCVYGYLKKLEKKGFIENIKYHISMKKQDAEFIEKLDANTDLLGFEDGVYDLEKAVFRRAEPQDYISYSVGFNYPMTYTDNKENLEMFFRQIFPTEEVRYYVLNQLSQSLSGRLKKHLIHFHTGYGGNGKSILCKLMDFALGDYSSKVNISLFTHRNNDTHSQGNPILHLIKGRRFIYASEPKNNDKINEAILKDMSGGECINYRLLFSNDVYKFFPQNHINIFCNKMPSVDGDDGGMERRVRVIDYISKFVNQNEVAEDDHKYLINYDLEYQISDWKMDFMRLLLDSYTVQYIDNPPQQVLEKSCNYLQGNNNIKHFVEEFLVKTNDKECFTYNDIKDFIKQDNELRYLKRNDIIQQLEKELQTPCKEKGKVKKDNKFIDVRSAFFGWTLKDLYEEHRNTIF